MEEDNLALPENTGQSLADSLQEDDLGQYLQYETTLGNTTGMEASNEALSIKDSHRASWLKRNVSKLGMTAFMISGAYFFAQPNQITETKDTIIKEASFMYEIFPITEGFAWGGAALMLASAGKKIGNPITMKRRLSLIRSELNDNSMYRTGWALGAIGALGTSTTIVLGSVLTLPDTSWPMAFSLSAASIAFSTIPFKPVRSKQ